MRGVAHGLALVRRRALVGSRALPVARSLQRHRPAVVRGPRVVHRGVHDEQRTRHHHGRLPTDADALQRLLVPLERDVVILRRRIPGEGKHGLGRRRIVAVVRGRQRRRRQQHRDCKQHRQDDLQSHPCPPVHAIPTTALRRAITPEAKPPVVRRRTVRSVHQTSTATCGHPPATPADRPDRPRGRWCGHGARHRGGVRWPVARR